MEFLNHEQKMVFKHLKNGKNVFITGQAGTGKTYTLNIICQWAKDNQYRIGKTSTTGISALLIGGQTIHSWSGIGIVDNESTKYDILYKVRRNQTAVSNWCLTKILIIDEISMLNPWIFELLDFIGRELRQSSKPFGGIQIVLTGDFAQLPPIDSTFVFESKIWDKSIDEIVYLKKNMRQKDPIFQRILTEIRLGNVTDESVKILESRVNYKFLNSEIQPTKLYSYRRTVQSINNESLSKLLREGNELITYNSNDEIFTKEKLTDKQIQYYKNKLNKTCQYPKQLNICIGCQVLLLTNLNLKSGLCNGSRGIVVKFHNSRPVVKFRNGIQTVIDHSIQEIKINPKTSVTRSQIPLVLAYAITIHKSQGSSLDCAQIDIGREIFTHGQAYVALSRIRSLQDLSLTDFNWKKITVHPKVLNFYKKLES